LLNCDQLLGLATTLLKIDSTNVACSLSRLAKGLNNNNYLLVVGEARYLVKEYRAHMPVDALFQQQRLSLKNITTNPIAWHTKAQVAVFDYWPGQVYRGQEWARFLPLLRDVHQSFRPKKHSKQDWSIDLTQEFQRIVFNDERESKAVAQALLRLNDFPDYTAYCHNDLVIENLLCDGESLRIIDFEFAGFNDVYFDLAALAVSLQLAESEAMRMLRAYHELDAGSPKTNEEKLKVYRYLYIVLCKHWYLTRGHTREATQLDMQLHLWS
jgi:thiamine kinase